MKLNGKRVVLTGASGGIGAALAVELAQQGCQLLLVGRNQDKLQQLLNSLEGANSHQLLSVDLTTREGRSRLLEVAASQPVDILINCLGINQLALLENKTEQDVEQILQTNLTVPILLCKQFTPLLQQRPESAIVNIGSILGSIGYAGSTVYCASKFGLRGFTESLRRELASGNIRVVYFAPRATDTALNSDEMTAMNKALGNTVDTPVVVAKELVKTLRSSRLQRFLGWPEAFFVRINSLLPGLVDKSLLKQLPIIRQFAGNS